MLNKSMIVLIVFLSLFIFGCINFCDYSDPECCARAYIKAYTQATEALNADNLTKEKFYEIFNFNCSYVYHPAPNRGPPSDDLAQAAKHKWCSALLEKNLINSTEFEICDYRDSLFIPAVFRD